MFIAEKYVKGHVLPNEVIAKAVTEVPDAVYRRSHIRTRRVNGQTYWCHPSVDKEMVHN